MVKYGTGKRILLDRDLLVLQRALHNKIPDWSEEEDWQLPMILEKYESDKFGWTFPSKNS